MRAIWSGAINFGLVNIPVKLYSASQENDLQFHYLHKEDLSKIRYAKICRRDGEVLSNEDIVLGYEYQKGDYVVLTDEDFKRANVRKTKTIDILDFTDEDKIDSRYFEKPYYLEPAKGAEKPYALLREALHRSGRVGLAKFVLRKKEHLAAIKVVDNAIVLQQMRFQAELRSPKELNLPEVEARDREIEMALALIDQLATDFNPEEYKDTYTDELKQVIEEKAKGQTPRPRSEEPVGTNVTDLMAVLKESLERQRDKPKKKAG